MDKKIIYLRVDSAFYDTVKERAETANMTLAAYCKVVLGGVYPTPPKHKQKASEGKEQK